MSIFTEERGPLSIDIKTRAQYPLFNLACEAWRRFKKIFSFVRVHIEYIVSFLLIILITYTVVNIASAAINFTPKKFKLQEVKLIHREEGGLSAAIYFRISGVSKSTVFLLNPGLHLVEKSTDTVLVRCKSKDVLSLKFEEKIKRINFDIEISKHTTVSDILHILRKDDFYLRFSTSLMPKIHIFSPIISINFSCRKFIRKTEQTEKSENNLFLWPLLQKITRGEVLDIDEIHKYHDNVSFEEYMKPNLCLVPKIDECGTKGKIFLNCEFPNLKVCSLDLETVHLTIRTTNSNNNECIKIKLHKNEMKKGIIDHINFESDNENTMLILIVALRNRLDGFAGIELVSFDFEENVKIDRNNSPALVSLPPVEIEAGKRKSNNFYKVVVHEFSPLDISLTITCGPRSILRDIKHVFEKKNKTKVFNKGIIYSLEGHTVAHCYAAVNEISGCKVIELNLTHIFWERLIYIFMNRNIYIADFPNIRMKCIYNPRTGYFKTCKYDFSDLEDQNELIKLSITPSYEENNYRSKMKSEIEFPTPNCMKIALRCGIEQILRDNSNENHEFCFELKKETKWILHNKYYDLIINADTQTSYRDNCGCENMHDREKFSVLINIEINANSIFSSINVKSITLDDLKHLKIMTEREEIPIYISRIFSSYDDFRRGVESVNRFEVKKGIGNSFDLCVYPIENDDRHMIFDCNFKTPMNAYLRLKDLPKSLMTVKFPKNIVFSTARRGVCFKNMILNILIQGNGLSPQFLQNMYVDHDDSNLLPNKLLAISFQKTAPIINKKPILRVQKIQIDERGSDYNESLDEQQLETNSGDTNFGNDPTYKKLRQLLTKNPRLISKSAKSFLKEKTKEINLLKNLRVNKQRFELDLKIESDGKLNVNLKAKTKRENEIRPNDDIDEKISKADLKNYGNSNIKKIDTAEFWNTYNQLFEFPRINLTMYFSRIEIFFKVRQKNLKIFTSCYKIGYIDLNREISTNLFPPEIPFSILPKFSNIIKAIESGLHSDSIPLITFEAASNVHKKDKLPQLILYTIDLRELVCKRRHDAPRKILPPQINPSFSPFKSESYKLLRTFDRDFIENNRSIRETIIILKDIMRFFTMNEGICINFQSQNKEVCIKFHLSKTCDDDIKLYNLYIDYKFDIKIPQLFTFLAAFFSGSKKSNNNKKADQQVESKIENWQSQLDQILENLQSVDEGKWGIGIDKLIRGYFFELLPNIINNILKTHDFTVSQSSIFNDVYLYCDLKKPSFGIIVNFENLNVTCKQLAKISKQIKIGSTIIFIDCIDNFITIKSISMVVYFDENLEKRRFENFQEGPVKELLEKFDYYIFKFSQFLRNLFENLSDDQAVQSISSSALLSIILEQMNKYDSENKNITKYILRLVNESVDDKNTLKRALKKVFWGGVSGALNIFNV